jgi:hypothetical protein
MTLFLSFLDLIFTVMLVVVGAGIAWQQWHLRRLCDALGERLDAQGVHLKAHDAHLAAATAKTLELEDRLEQLEKRATARLN